MDLSTFNQALLLKWYWQWGKPQTTLCKPLFEQHITNRGLPDSPIFNNAMRSSMNFCKFAFTYVPGNGERILFWDNKWTGITIYAQFPNLYTFALDTNISLKQVSHATTLDSLFRNDLSDIAQEELVWLQLMISGLQLNPLSQDDLIWPWNDAGKYTVRSGYRAMKNIPQIQSNTCKIWKLNVPPRMKVFGWLMLLNKLFTIDNLNKMGWSIVNRYVLCKEQSESIKHMLDGCIFSKAVYLELRRALPGMMPSIDAVPTIELITSNKFTKKQRGTVLITQFCIWRERCNRTFTEESKQVRDIKDEVLWQLQFISERISENGE